MYAVTCKDIGVDPTLIDMKVTQIDSKNNSIKTITYVRFGSMDSFGWLN